MRIRGFFLFRRYYLFIFVILLLLFAFVLMSFRAKQSKGIEFFDVLLLETCSPFQKGATFIIKAIQEIFQQYFFLIHVEEENRVLKQKLMELKEENHQLKEMKLENERLRRLLQFNEKNSLTTMGAEVIGHDPTSWFKSVTIDKGERDGVRKGMAVISPEGVIGQILKTSPHYSTVLLITDYNSAIDSIVQRTRAKTIIEGKGENRCQLKYLLRTEDAAEGDVVVTSGLAGNFPKGLKIGEISKVDKKGHGVFQYAELVPSADLNHLEEVFIIIKPLSPISIIDEKKEKKIQR